MPRSLPAVIHRDRDSMLEKSVYTRLEQTIRRKLAVIAQDLIAGKITRQAAYAAGNTEIRNATLTAFRVGKSVGVGVRSTGVTLTRPEFNRATLMGAFQAAKLRSWLLSSEPLVKPGLQGVGPRLDMYALSLHGAYQTGLGFGLLQAASVAKGMRLLEDDPIWLWKRSSAPAVASCKDCIAREARSKMQPYTLTELLTIGFPATGHTQCLTRCRCHIELVPIVGSGLLASILKARSHRRTKPTAYWGVVDPDTIAGLGPGKVGPGK